MSRDRELVGWVGRLGAVEVRQVGERFGVGRSVAYGLVARLIEAGLLERLALLRGEPALIRATEAGLRFAGLGLSVAPIRLGELRHWIACADIALWAERAYGREALISERELRFAEQLEGRPIASAVLGELPDGRPMLHRPDLVVTAYGRAIAVEVELTPKAPARLKAIVKAWRRARHVEHVVYFCAPGPTHRALERAVTAVHATERIEVRDLARVPLTDLTADRRRAPALPSRLSVPRSDVCTQRTR